MAKKKKKTTGRATKNRAKKKVVKKGKAVRKKSSPKKAAKKAPKKSSKKPAKVKNTGAGAKSVDGLLKKYEKERSAQGSQLATLGKKIKDLQAKTRVYENQIVKLQTQENALQVAIAKLDSRRDKEVGKLLGKLGVQLGDGGSGFVSSKPVADREDSSDTDADANGDDSAEPEDEDADEVEEGDAEPADESGDET